MLGASRSQLCKAPLTPSVTQAPPPPHQPHHAQVWSLIGLPGRDGEAPAANLLPSHTLRVVIINKQSDRGCNVELRLPKAANRKHAELHWLKNDGGVDSKSRVEWRGQTYQGTFDGKLTGERGILNLAPSGEAGDSTVFKVPVPPGQAVLLVTAAATPED